MPVKAGIRKELYNLLNSLMEEMIYNQNKSSKTLKDLLNDFSQFLYTNKSSNIKVKEKAYNCLSLQRQARNHCNRNARVDDSQSTSDKSRNF